MTSASIKIRAAFALTLTVAASGAPLLGLAQQVPNFSGVWIGRSEPLPRPETGVLSPAQHWALGQPVTITQTTKAITIAYKSNGRRHNDVLLTYNLDGTETQNTDVFPPHPKLASTAAWEGTTLVLITVTYGSGPSAIRYEYRDRLIRESATTFRLESVELMGGRQATRVARFQPAGAPRLPAN